MNSWYKQLCVVSLWEWQAYPLIFQAYYRALFIISQISSPTPTPLGLRNNYTPSANCITVADYGVKCNAVVANPMFMTCMRGYLTTTRPWYQGSWGQHGAHLGPTGPRWIPCGPHELCYLGWQSKGVVAQPGRTWILFKNKWLFYS